MKTGFLMTWHQMPVDGQVSEPHSVLITSKKALLKYLGDVISDHGYTYLADPYSEIVFSGIALEPLSVVDERFNLEDMKDEAP